ncbi:MAG: DUF2336 domain-containing protein [Cohaesibacter sp.]|nr:DUF2336 domain-containing protein [Cohaesibacter sp.]MCV6603417.1 DUF2336 domain-containing protein [Cohaesibacter sp.]
MYAALKTELVDLKSLDDENGHGKSDELVRHVSSLFALTSEHCTDEQLYTYDVVLQRLADIVDVSGRAYASEKLSSLQRAPYALIRRFAFDVIKVAGPVLRKSPVLSDQDLLDVSDERGADHMLAISCRKDLSVAVTDLLIHYAHGPVLMQLAANGRAQISPKGMQVLQHLAANDVQIAQSLQQRQSQKERLHLVKNPGSPLAKELNLSEIMRDLETQIPAEKLDLSRNPYLARYKFEASAKRAQDLQKKSRLNETSLLRYAGHDQFADVICGIALMSGISYKILACMMSSLHWEQVLCLFKVMRFSDRLVSELLCCGPWKLRLSRNQCIAILKHYRQMSVEQAHAKVLLWSRDGIILD